MGVQVASESPFKGETMLIVNVNVNERIIDQIGVVNTGHKNKETGETLYRIKHPEDYKKEFNHIEIWHRREDPWSILIEKTLQVVNQNPDFINETIQKRETIKLFNMLETDLFPNMENI